MNIKLLQRIKAQILAEPKKFRMDDWNCGTAMCIGGLACALKRRRFNVDADGIGPKGWKLANGEHTLSAALRYLELSREQGNGLFNENYWPEQFGSPYRAASPKSSARARIAAERIDHFIATNGTE